MVRLNSLDDAGISVDRLAMNNDRDDPQQLQDARRRLKDLADKCDAGGRPDLAAQVRKGSRDLASDESNRPCYTFVPFTPLKDNKLWRRLLAIAVGVAFVVWGVVSIFIGHITVTHHNYIYEVNREPFGFWLVVACILFLGAGSIFRGIQGRK
jgi:hypothetical protein